MQGDVIKVVADFFQTRILPKELNHTHIVLLPKKQTPVVMGDFRPISLYNVLYKVISKVVANRLHSVLPFVIPDMQSAFLPSRMITDNVIISYEIMHYLKRKYRGKGGFMAVKIDMSKAYDRLEWGYLRALLLHLGFDEKWVKLIMTCVESVTYSIMYQNKELGLILSGRGIRQGGPLSPYLFILCSEGLSALFKVFECSSLIHGCRVARRAPIITHILFADDCYVYFRATEEEAF